ncbi:MAG: carbon-nitrogen hydrolase family protein [Acidobacteria bacterium]|nr:MAG: carbon-nitrogen hydrolase family protein [Acidobacteriota bacterium]
MKLKVALVQICSTEDVRRNCARALEWIEAAAQRGARWVLFPENTCYIRGENDPVSWSEPLDGPIVESFCRAAQRWGIYVLLGSMPEPIPGSTKVYNTSLLIGPEGDILAAYRKLHLFDAVLPDGRVLSESRFVEKGDDLALAHVDGVTVGLSICYDLRFPELYRALTVAGAEVLTVPSAFTVPTGQAHWEILLRSRAIENQAFVLAPAQTGQHTSSRRSYGHSMIIDPWGRVIAAVGQEETVVEAELEMDQVRQIRRRMPCLRHRRFDIVGPNEGHPDAARGGERGGHV